ncbi:phosphoribosyltransferase family protein [Asanoa sp. WMMD1127]|uniref:phosphoribosyltransferase n=1 Tax=Asanoa sp. WMMD1127 TaxID=3016107 RepID=UPI002415CF59|nr:phosphoribosyltransferase family protein [Asanoa sp. WMMD1127]MDG4822130.1 phosphoribosyltransferase family protein [Asanoa sp. WMMD1127]
MDGSSFPDRAAAGAVLADALGGYAGRTDVLVLGLVRGGIPVAAAVAGRLDVALDALVIRKLGVPWSPEVAFGALGPGGVMVVNDDVAARLEQGDVDAVVSRESAELSRREAIYRRGRPPLSLAGTVAVLVDDGLATGASARAAVAVARALSAARVVLAVPVGSVRALRALEPLVDELVCPLRPAPFGAVSEFYDDFHQVSDREVAAALDSARVRPPGTV